MSSPSSIGLLAATMQAMQEQDRAATDAVGASRLPQVLNLVDSTLDGMIRKLEFELINRPSASAGNVHPSPPQPVADPAANELGAHLRRVLAGSRVQVERDVLVGSLRQTETELDLAAAREKSLTEQLSVSRLLSEDLSSLGDQLRVAKNQLKARDDEAASTHAEQQRTCEALQQAAAGRASDARELRASNSSLREELGSWRAACDFLEAQLAEARQELAGTDAELRREREARQTLERERGGLLLERTAAEAAAEAAAAEATAVAKAKAAVADAAERAAATAAAAAAAAAAGDDGSGAASISAAVSAEAKLEVALEAAASAAAAAAVAEAKAQHEATAAAALRRRVASLEAEVAATARAHAQLEEELLVARRRAAQAEAGALHGAAAQGAVPELAQLASGTLDLCHDALHACGASLAAAAHHVAEERVLRDGQPLLLHGVGVGGGVGGGGGGGGGVGDADEVLLLRGLLGDALTMCRDALTLRQRVDGVTDDEEALAAARLNLDEMVAATAGLQLSAEASD